MPYFLRRRGAGDVGRSSDRCRPGRQNRMCKIMCANPSPYFLRSYPFWGACYTGSVWKTNSNPTTADFYTVSLAKSILMRYSLSQSLTDCLEIGGKEYTGMTLNTQEPMTILLPVPATVQHAFLLLSSEQNNFAFWLESEIFWPLSPLFIRFGHPQSVFFRTLTANTKFDILVR